MSSLKQITGLMVSVLTGVSLELSYLNASQYQNSTSKFKILMRTILAEKNSVWE